MEDLPTISGLTDTSTVVAATGNTSSAGPSSAAGGTGATEGGGAASIGAAVSGRVVACKSVVCRRCLFVCSDCSCLCLLMFVVLWNEKVKLYFPFVRPVCRLSSFFYDLLTSFQYIF